MSSVGEACARWIWKNQGSSLWLCQQFANLKMAIEIESCPINSMVDLSIVVCMFTRHGIQISVHTGSIDQAWKAIKSNMLQWREHTDHAYLSCLTAETVRQRWSKQNLLVLNIGNGWVAGGCWDDYWIIPENSLRLAPVRKGCAP